MVANYFKTIFRHLLKTKFISLLRLSGLTVALFSFFVISVYISYQLSFDRFHTDADNIYRVNSIRSENGHLQQYAVVPPALGTAMQSEIPEVLAMSRVSIAGRQLVRYKDQLLRPNGFVEVDSSVFDVLTFRFVQGNRHALDMPGSVVLTQSLAGQIYGDEDPLGKTLTFVERFGRTLTVTGVVEDWPTNAHLDIRALLGRRELADSLELSDSETWSQDTFTHLYVRLSPSAEIGSFAGKVKPLLEKNLPRREDGSEKAFGVFLQPVTGIYFAPPMKMEFTRKGNIVYVYGFAILGIFLLIIATINYLNLSYADMSTRIKEMGIRKILGAGRKQITILVVIEVLVICTGALLLSLGFVYLLFPEIQRLLELNLRLNMLLDFRILLAAGLAITGIVMGASLAPALFLSGDTSAKNLSAARILGGTSGRGFLLLVQFSISILCACVTLVVGRQLDFIQQSDIGYDRSRVVAMLMPDRYPVEQAPVLKNTIAALAGVESVSFSYYLISGAPYLKGWYRAEIEGQMKPLMINEVFVDHDFLRTMSIPVVAGRNFDLNNPMDSKSAFIINETAAREFGWEDPIGKRFSVGYDEEAGAWQGAIVGVVQDFHIRPLQERMEPLVMRLQFDHWPGYWLNVKVMGPMEETLTAIKSAYESVLPGYLADTRLLEDAYKRQYQQEAKAQTALLFGTWMIVIISCMGIFSLAMYLSIQRTKEFGIRKVLGATVQQITSLHVNYFLRIAMVANILALPVAWWIAGEWLSGFVYRTDSGLELFGSVGVISFVLLILTAGYAAIRAGMTNPVDAIKTQ